jgi:succinate-semialdehyde dehydrogenase/glutarate-semialdehyde dehydrogenase
VVAPASLTRPEIPRYIDLPEERHMPFQSVNPSNGELLASFPETSAAKLGEIVDAADAAQRAWAATPIELRAAPMRRAAELLRSRAAELARLAALEMGKPLADGTAEVLKCALVCEHYAEHAAAYLTPRTVETEASRSFVRFDPLGVILAIMPWNFPYWQVFRFVAPNLMAGNAGLLKHATNASQCALAIEKVLRDAGFPPELFRTLLIGHEEALRLIEDPRIAGVTLTGSEHAGRAVGERAGRALKPSVLELGGSDPFIVLADADVPRAARTAAAARTINAGQSCICAKRFIVVESVYARFVDEMKQAMARIRVGDPLEPGTEIGPLARRDLRDQLQAQVDTAVSEGARVILGGTPGDGPGAFYPPTILDEVRPDNLAAREELFGPVAALLRARDTDEAIALANASRFGLAASLWTGDRALAEKLVPQLKCGLVFVNAMVKSDPRLPFGGVKSSGYGRELGLEGARAFVDVKTVFIA